jgi:hypothetical protein
MHFPTATSNWPESQTSIAKAMAGVADEQRTLILAGNAARLYRL